MSEKFEVWKSVPVTISLSKIKIATFGILVQKLFETNPNSKGTNELKIIIEHSVEEWWEHLAGYLIKVGSSNPSSSDFSISLQKLSEM